MTCRAFRSFLRYQLCPGMAAALVLSASSARAQQSSADSTPKAADSTEASVPQRDVMDILAQILHGKPEKPTVGAPPGLVLTLLPAFSVNPSTGLLVGVAVNALKRLGPPETTNSSTASLSVNYTTKQQFNVLARSNIFGSGNSFLLQGDWRYLDTSQPTYGLGPALPDDQKDDLQYNLIRIYQTAYRPVTGQLLMGFGYHLNDYFNIVDPKAEQGLPSPLLDYNGGQKVTTMISSGLSAGPRVRQPRQPDLRDSGHTTCPRACGCFPPGWAATTPGRASSRTSGPMAGSIARGGTFSPSGPRHGSPSAHRLIWSCPRSAGTPTRAADGAIRRVASGVTIRSTWRGSIV